MKFFSLLTVLSFLTGCASAQNAIERRLIPEAELSNLKFAQADTTSNAMVDNAAWNDFLEKYSAPGATGVILVNYAAVTASDRRALDKYIGDLEQTNVIVMNSDEQLAFWINLYNARTVALILEHYPISSIRGIKSGLFDFDGPWDNTTVSVLGETLTLNDIEHNIIRAVFKEPRIHYAVNCASIGCPNLRAQAFEGQSIDEALEQAARAYVNHPRGVRIEKNRVVLSKIYSWYAEDFGENDAAILDHIRKYAGPDLSEQLKGRTKINAYEYDWALNDAGAKN